MPPRPVVSRPGPPPHAPAHGHRYKHQRHGIDLVFDSGLGVYVVVGSEDVFFHRDHFYRLTHAGWENSFHLDRGWISVDAHRLPPGLVKKRHKTKRHKAERRREKRQHPAKRHR